jgi:hypothetical protein
MLKVNLNEGRYEIVQHLTRICSAFGIISSIGLFLESSPTAVVEMATMKETRELAARLGGRMVGNTAFIELSRQSYEVMQKKAA